MLNRENIKIFHDIMNNNLNISIESNIKLEKGIFTDKTINEDCFRSLRIGYSDLGMENYYSSFFNFIDIIKQHVSLDDARSCNDLYDHNEFFTRNQNSIIFKEILNNHLAYNMSNFVEYVDIGVQKWSLFAKESGIDASEEKKKIAKLGSEYSKEMKKIITPLINLIKSFQKQANHLSELNDKLSIYPNNKSVQDEIIEGVNNLHNFLNKNEAVIKEYRSKKFKDILNIESYDDVILNIFKQFESIYERGCKNTNTFFSLADNFVTKSKNVSATSDFLNNKLFSEKLLADIQFKSGPYTHAKLFEDNSMVIIDRENNQKRLFSVVQAIDLIKNIIKSDIQYTFRKNPVISNNFSKLYDQNPNSPISIYLVMETYIKNEDVLKGQKFNIVDELNGIKKNICEDRNDFDNLCESLDDKMNKLVKEHKIKQYAHSIASNKYMHLYDETSYKIIKSIYDLEIESSLLQNDIGKKIAAFHTSDDFNLALKKLLDSYGEFTPDKIKAKALQCKAHIVYEDDNKIILDIDDFKQSQIMGSSSWCISREKHYFESYVGSRNHQYFIYDFSKDSSDNKSIIGITLTPEISCNAAHLKNDDALDEYDQLALDNIEIILKNDGSWYEEALIKREKYSNLMKAIVRDPFF